MKFTMPFEGDPHAATWMCWPFDEEEWRGQLNDARSEYALLVRTLAEVEDVHLLVAQPEAERDALHRLRGIAPERLHLHRIPLDDVWFRDNGPIFVSCQGRVQATRWTFNAWGGKYEHEWDAQAADAVCRVLGVTPRRGALTLEGGALEVDGQGLGLTTRPCLVGPTRNPGLDEASIERALNQVLGTERWIWLDAGLEGDHTDGHIDTIVRFVRPGQVLANAASPDDRNHDVLVANRERLRAHGLEVIDLPIPSRPREFEGLRLPETYANFYLANGIAVVPLYGDANDERALAILREAFPDRHVIGLSSSAIITSGGSFHCLTQQQPQGELCSSH